MLGHRPRAGAVTAAHQARHGCQSSAEAPSRNARRPGTWRALQAVRAFLRMHLMLDRFRDHLRQLGNLMAQRLADFHAPVTRKLPLAVLAPRWPMVLDAGDCVGRKRLSVVSLVPRLPSWLPTRRLPLRRQLQQRRITRRRPRRILRVLVQSTLQLRDPSILLLNSRQQSQDERMRLFQRLGQFDLRHTPTASPLCAHASFFTPPTGLNGYDLCTLDPHPVYSFPDPEAWHWEYKP